MKQKEGSKKYFTPNEVAELLMVSPVTVRQWANKGQINALTTPGGHRRFLYRDVERFAREQGIALISEATAKNRILVVDDDEQLARFLFEILSSKVPSAEIEVAHDGFEAGRKVQLFQPQVILLDLMMPGLNGFEVCKRIRENPVTRATKIIAMTGYYTDENVARICEAGANACIEKPIDIKKLFGLLGVVAAEELLES
ncbi:MAG: response regulator [Gammaproteobacteria bacterium]|nr:response regulator [Gammaproteobacteria bacterium]MDH5730110.1 response regulator [Gammaproteobacteria bacterium]